MTLRCRSCAILKEIPGIFCGLVPSGMHPSLNAFLCSLKIVPKPINLLPSGHHFSIRRIQIIPSALGLYPTRICLMIGIVKLPSTIFVCPVSCDSRLCISRKSGLYCNRRRKHHKYRLLFQCFFHVALLCLLSINSLKRVQIPFPVTVLNCLSLRRDAVR